MGCVCVSYDFMYWVLFRVPFSPANSEHRCEQSFRALPLPTTTAGAAGHRGIESAHTRLAAAPARARGLGDLSGYTLPRGIQGLNIHVQGLYALSAALQTRLRLPRAPAKTAHGRSVAHSVIVAGNVFTGSG